MNKAFRRILLFFFPIILILSVTSMNKAFKNDHRPIKPIGKEEQKATENNPKIILTSSHRQ